jgi:hypothetical protein
MRGMYGGTDAQGEGRGPTRHGEPSGSVASPGETENPRGEGGDAGHGVRHSCEPARARWIRGGQPVAAEGKGGAAVAEEGTQTTGADPATPRGPGKHDGAGARENEESRALADGAAVCRLHVRDHGDAPSELMELSGGGATLRGGPDAARGHHHVRHAGALESPPAPESTKRRGEVARRALLRRPASPAVIGCHGPDPRAARVHAHRPCARHVRHFPPGRATPERHFVPRKPRRSVRDC